MQSENFLDSCEEEFYQFIDTIIRMDMLPENTEKKKSESNTLSNSKLIRFLKSIAQFLTLDYTEISYEMISIVLRIFIKFLNGTTAEIEEQNNTNDNVLIKRRTTMYTANKSQRNTENWDQGMINLTLVEKQNVLMDLGMIEIVNNSIRKEKNPEILDYLMNLAVKLLEGGNSYGQERLLNYLLEDKDNELFLALRDMFV